MDRCNQEVVIVAPAGPPLSFPTHDGGSINKPHRNAMLTGDDDQPVVFIRTGHGSYPLIVSPFDGFETNGRIHC